MAQMSKSRQATCSSDTYYLYSRLHRLQGGAHLPPRIFALRTRPPIPHTTDPHHPSRSRSRHDTAILYRQDLHKPTLPLLRPKPPAGDRRKGDHRGFGRSALKDGIPAVLRELCPTASAVAELLEGFRPVGE